MKAKRSILLIIQFLSVFFIYGNNIIIEANDSYMNVVDYSDGKTELKINNTSNLTTFTYINETDNFFKLSFLENYTFIHFNNNDLSIDCKNNNINPEFSMNYNHNSFYIKLNDNLDWGFKLSLPSNNGYYFNLEIANDYFNNYKISIQQNKEFNTSFKSSLYSTTFGYQTNYHNLYLGLASEIFESDPDIKKDTLNIITKSEGAYNISIGYKYNKTDKGFYCSYEYSSLSLKDNSFAIIDFNNLFSYINTPDEITSNNINIKYFNKYFELHLKQSIYNTGSTSGYLETKPFIYGPFAFRKYDFNLSSFTLYTSEVEYKHKIRSIIGETFLGFQYLRLFSDSIDYTYNYKDLIWAFLKLETVNSSDVYYEKLEYNHLNIIDLSLMHKIDFKGFTLYGSINQKIPFFDETFSNKKLTTSASTSTGNSSNKIKLSGGTFINIGISFFL